MATEEERKRLFVVVVLFCFLIRLCSLGAVRSGKSSVQSVVFHKISPHETLFLDSTERVHKHEVGNSAFVQLEIFDIPGELGSEEAEMNLEGVMRGCSALIFVIDVTSEDTDKSLRRLHETIVRAYNANPNVFIEVFIHKADALTEEQKRFLQSELQERVDDELRETNDKVNSNTLEPHSPKTTENQSSTSLKMVQEHEVKGQRNRACFSSSFCL